MTANPSAPTFATLVQGFFCERLIEQQNASSRTVAAYRDTFRLERVCELTSAVLYGHEQDANLSQRSHG